MDPDEGLTDVARDPDVRRAIDLIYNTLRVSPPEHRMLTSFIRESVDAKSAASYILTRAHSKGNEALTVEAELQTILCDWREIVKRFGSNEESIPSKPSRLFARDNGRCCATGTSKVWWDMFGWSCTVSVQIVPEAVLKCLRDEELNPLHEMLSIFLTKVKLEQLAAELQSEVFELRNTWTLRTDVTVAFKTGQLYFEPGWNVTRRPIEDLKATCRYTAHMTTPEPFPKLPNASGGLLCQSSCIRLSTFDRDALPLPSAFLFNIHARMSVSLRSIQIQQQMTARQHLKPTPRLLQRLFVMPVTMLAPTLHKMWLFVPQRARIYAYEILLKIGLRLYGSQLAWVQRVPLGMYIKHGRGKLVPQGEASALCLVKEHTSISAPRLLDLITHENYTYLVMTRVPGVPLSLELSFMSYPQRSTLAIDLSDYLSAYRSIPNTNRSPICGADGGAVFDYRIPNRSAGPFDSEGEFNDVLVTQRRLRSPIHTVRHKIVFTHADLNLTNILVDKGRLSGLVDFGCAGFYPEYWDFTKAKFSEFGPDPAWTNLIAAVFGDTYLEEFEAEQKLWAVISTM